MGARPPRLERGTTCSTAGAGPPRSRALHAPLRILTRCPAPGRVRPHIAAGNRSSAVLAARPRLIRDSREPITARSAAICHASRSYRHGGGVRSGVCLREWLPVLTGGCRQSAPTWIRLRGSEGRDLAWPCRGPCLRPRRSVPVLALGGDNEPRTTGLGLPIWKVHHRFIEAQGSGSRTSIDSDFTARLDRGVAHTQLAGAARRTCSPSPSEWSSRCSTPCLPTM